jgi:ATP/maltotriose-dependent transcriptional regulator MalT
MDRNTITGLILIFVIFIGFSIYNSNKANKAFEKAVLIAESDYAKGDLETARSEYINALRLKPNQPDVIAKINEINLKLGISSEKQKSDSLSLLPTKSDIPISKSSVVQTDINQYGVFATSATG